MNGIGKIEMQLPYSSVLSEKLISEVSRLLQYPTSPETANSIYLSQAQHKRSLLELQGMGKKIWKHTDPKVYIDSLRGEWDAG